MGSKILFSLTVSRSLYVLTFFKWGLRCQRVNRSAILNIQLKACLYKGSYRG